jgi:hypothetical protein
MRCTSNTLILYQIKYSVVFIASYLQRVTVIGQVPSSIHLVSIYVCVHVRACVCVCVYVCVVLCCVVLCCVVLCS